MVLGVLFQFQFTNARAVLTAHLPLSHPRYTLASGAGAETSRVSGLTAELLGQRAARGGSAAVGDGAAGGDEAAGAGGQGSGLAGSQPLVEYKEEASEGVRVLSHTFPPRPSRFLVPADLYEDS